jgi:hypothetical protein
VRHWSVGHHAPCETGLCKSRPVAPRDVGAHGKVKGAPRDPAGCRSAGGTIEEAVPLMYLASRLLPPSPPAEKATARQDQARQASANDGARHRAYEAEIIGGLKHLARGGQMLIVRPETRLLSVSGSKVCVLGTWHRRVGAPLAPTCVRARTGPNAS